MKFCLGFIVSFLVAASPLLAAEAQGKYSVKKGLVYSSAGGGMKLDVFLPESSDAKAVPCVIVIQGGGFAAQTGQRFKPFAVYLAERGFAAALISYRGRPNHKYHATIADTKAAVRFVRKISAENNIDPKRIGAMGSSAGGTLAGLLAVTGGNADLEGDGGHAEYSSSVQAAVTMAGVFDFVGRFTKEEYIKLQPNIKTKIVTNGEWIGPPFSPTNKDWLKASAITHVDAKDAPMLMLHCRDDSTVSWPQSREMHARMEAAGVASELKIYETGGHGFRKLGQQPKADMVNFFRKTLASKSRD